MTVFARSALCLAALLAICVPDALLAQQFGGARRVEVAMSYPFTAVGKWTTANESGGRTVCTAFLVNNCTLVTAARCGMGTSGSFQFEASDGLRFQIRNVQAKRKPSSAAVDKTGGKPIETPDLDVAFGQIAARAGQAAPGEKYGRFGFDDADTVAAITGLTPHCSYGFSSNDEGKGGRGTLDPDVFVWGPLRRWFPTTVGSDEFFVHMTNGAYGASGSPIFRCVPIFKEGKLLGIDVGAPTRVIGVYVRLNNDKDGLKFTDRLRVEPRDMAWGIGSQQFYPYLVDYVKDHPCEALR
jgi:hypothetical protein